MRRGLPAGRGAMRELGPGAAMLEDAAGAIRAVAAGSLERGPGPLGSSPGVQARTRRTERRWTTSIPSRVMAGLLVRSRAFIGATWKYGANPLRGRPK